MDTGGIPLKILEWNKEELWDSWQRDVGNNKGIGKLEASVGRHMFQVWDLDRSQELRILYEGTEVESETNLMGFIKILYK